MKDLLDKLTILEDQAKNNTIEVDHLFEADEEDKNLKMNTQSLKILSDKINVDPQRLRVTISKILRNQPVSGEDRKTVTELVKLLIKQSPVLLNRMQ